MEFRLQIPCHKTNYQSITDILFSIENQKRKLHQKGFALIKKRYHNNFNALISTDL
jgi:hypothetical protein